MVYRGRRPCHRVLPGPMAGKLLSGRTGPPDFAAAGSEALRQEYGRHGNPGSQQTQTPSGQGSGGQIPLGALRHVPEGRLAGLPGGGPADRFRRLPILPGPHHHAEEKLPANDAAVPKSAEAREDGGTHPPAYGSGNFKPLRSAETLRRTESNGEVPASTGRGETEGGGAEWTERSWKSFAPSRSTRRR